LTEPKLNVKRENKYQKKGGKKPNLIKYADSWNGSYKVATSFKWGIQMKWQKQNLKIPQEHQIISNLTVVDGVGKDPQIEMRAL